MGMDQISDQRLQRYIPNIFKELTQRIPEKRVNLNSQNIQLWNADQEKSKYL
jgi:hypothetical protein